MQKYSPSVLCYDVIEMTRAKNRLLREMNKTGHEHCMKSNIQM